jgi:hypothetical protein
MRTLQSEAHLRPIQTLLLSKASSQCEAIQEQSEFNAGIHRTASGARREYTDTRRHFELSQNELTGTLSEYEIDCAKRRGWM